MQVAVVQHAAVLVLQLFTAAVGGNDISLLQPESEEFSFTCALNCAGFLDLPQIISSTHLKLVGFVANLHALKQPCKFILGCI